MRLFEKAVELQRQQDHLVQREQVPDAVADFVKSDAPLDPTTRSRAMLQGKQVLIAGNAGDDDTKALVAAVRRGAGNPMIVLIDSPATVCDQGSCRKPTTDPARVLAWLEESLR